ncbi:hypothetical protein B0H13DRAFT_2328493 [Mycena leptocephala]|nr:hypothetical protein B0H13DRAFT_2328493 [Mycena leptocephala]
MALNNVLEQAHLWICSLAHYLFACPDLSLPHLPLAFRDVSTPDDVNALVERTEPPPATLTALNECLTCPGAETALSLFFSLGIHRSCASSFPQTSFPVRSQPRGAFSRPLLPTHSSFLRLDSCWPLILLVLAGPSFVLPFPSLLLPSRICSMLLRLVSDQTDVTSQFARHTRVFPLGSSKSSSMDPLHLAFAITYRILRGHIYSLPSNRA